MKRDPVARCQCGFGFRYLVPTDPPNHGFTVRIWQVQCLGCGCAGPWSQTREEAADLWNAMRARADPEVSGG